MTAKIKAIAWDFDGVLNRSFVDNRFIWQDNFEADIGHSIESFTQLVFQTDFKRILTGQEDVRDRVALWAKTVGYEKSPDSVIDYWFRNEALPDAEVLELMSTLSQHGIRQVIATNNEHRRANYIENDMGFGKRVEHVFASGRIGLAKPDPAFFEHITQALNITPGEMLLVDDHAGNIQAAQQLGWQAFHFTDQTRDQLKATLNLQ